MLCQIYTIYITKNYLKHENKTDNRDFGKFGMKIGPVLYLQELPQSEVAKLHNWVLPPSVEAQPFWPGNGSFPVVL